MDALIVAVGSEPDSEPFAAVAPVDGRGWFAAGEDCLSGVPGVLVAGDCRAKGVRQLTTGPARPWQPAAMWTRTVDITNSAREKRAANGLPVSE